jgi:EAL domain-containing protein (putative c-di-GMP-specific phosphodiesterase class I)
MDIGRNLGYEIIAEGVEEKTEADYLKSIGCHYAQGYYFGKPMPIAEWIKDRNAPTDNDAIKASVGSGSSKKSTRHPGELLHQEHC